LRALLALEVGPPTLRFGSPHRLTLRAPALLRNSGTLYEAEGQQMAIDFSSVKGALLGITLLALQAGMEQTSLQGQRAIRSSPHRKGNN
jgi:hypothetical protein